MDEKEREIFMGALVSPGGGYDCEKSIDVPCIILSTYFLLSFLSFPFLLYNRSSLSSLPLSSSFSCSRSAPLLEDQRSDWPFFPQV
jgi:hypothetical protein